MDLFDILNLKFPNSDFMRDIILQDDGQGPYIKEWNLNIDIPTQIDLDQWGIDLIPQYEFQQNKITNQPIYSQLDLIDLKSIRAIRENDQTRIADLESQAAALRAQLLPVT